MKNRILNPMRRVGDSGETYVEATWDEAIADIAGRMTAAIETGGPDAIGTHTRYFVGLSTRMPCTSSPRSRPEDVRLEPRAPSL